MLINYVLRILKKNLSAIAENETVYDIESLGKLSLVL